MTDPPASDVRAAPGHSRWSAIARLAIGFTGLSLVAYVPYRYVTRPPEFGGILGTTYALLFPLSLLLAAGAIYLSIRPSALGRIAEAPGERGGARAVLGAYGGLWVLMGLMCIPSLSALAESAPLQGLFATIHMGAQHVLLGFGAVAAAWRPEVADAVLRGEEPVPDLRSVDLVADPEGGG